MKHDKSTELATRIARNVPRRDVLVAGGAITAAWALLPAFARASAGVTAMSSPRDKAGATGIELTIGRNDVDIGGRQGSALTINGTVPGPLLRLREGEEAVIRVTNALEEDTSIHWHGLLVPPEMDGVPGVSFPGIPPRTTFEYRFPVRQYGTYWYHSHSGFQEQLGVYGPMIIEPAGGAHPFAFDREHVVVLSDWTFDNPHRVAARLKKKGGYYNFQKRTAGDFVADIAQRGFAATVRERWSWARMRMDPTDIMDVTGATYTYLMNGLAPAANWTGLFKPGERVLLRFINSAANSYFDVRVPGLPMTVVEVSGQHVVPVETDELRIATAETFAVIVEPTEDRAYTVFAESMDRSGHARGTLAPRHGMTAAVPKRRKRPVLTMADMGMEHGGAMGDMSMPDAGAKEGAQTGDHGGMDMPDAGAEGGMPLDHGDMGGMDMGGGSVNAVDSSKPSGLPAASDGQAPGGDPVTVAEAGAIRTLLLRAPGTLPGMVKHEQASHGPGNVAVPMMMMNRLGEPGAGLGEDGWRVLLYTDLRALEARRDFRAPTREIEMHLTGNMERFMWSIDGVPFDQSEDVELTLGERLRLTLANDTMMSHPMHLHGMWMELENGHKDRTPRVHTVNVKPSERLSLLIDVDAPGRWAFHCHLLYHMEVGMFRVFRVLPKVAAGEQAG